MSKLTDTEKLQMIEKELTLLVDTMQEWNDRTLYGGWSTHLVEDIDAEMNKIKVLLYNMSRKY